MRKSSIPLMFLLMGIIINTFNVGAFPETVEAIDFTLLNGSITNLSNYQDKPIVLDWTASWCELCKQNLQTFDSIYENYKDYVNFITLGYSRSGDNLDKIKGVQKSFRFPWTFGFDHTDYSEVSGAGNADVWILDENLNIVYSWDQAVVLKSDFIEKLSDVVGEVTTVINSDGINITSTIDLKEENNEIETFGLLKNPFFIGFVGISSFLVILVIISKSKN